VTDLHFRMMIMQARLLKTRQERVDLLGQIVTGPHGERAQMTPDAVEHVVAKIEAEEAAHQKVSP
jgi:hypothetical protein